MSEELFVATALEGNVGWQTPHWADSKSVEAIRRAVEAGHDLVRIAVCHRKTGALKGDEIVRVDRILRLDTVEEIERCVFINPQSTNPETRDLNRWREQLDLSQTW
jgi:hypothetical protein